MSLLPSSSTSAKNVRCRTQTRNKNKPMIFHYWGKVYKYKEDQQNGKCRREFVAVPADIPCIGRGKTKEKAIEEVRGKVECIVSEYQKHLKCPPIPSPPQHVDQMLSETEQDAQEDGSEILEQELFCVEIET